MEAYMFEEEMFMGLLSGLFTGVPSMLFSIAAYVLSALALYTIARRRGLRSPWMAWVPVANSWIIGSISDQYRYVVRGENRSKRKSLVVLSILSAVFTVALVVLFVVLVVSAANNGMRGVSEQEMLSDLFGLLMAMLGLCLPLAAVAIAFAVIRYMALFDIYRSLDPSNSVMYLVLSIVVGVTEPFFLFFNRNKDTGMPPRKQEQPAYIPEEPRWQYQEPVQEPWENAEDGKDYL